MPTGKLLREARKVIDAAGLTLVRVERATHYHFHLRNQHGVERVMVVSCTSGDRNIVDVLKRKARHIANDTSPEEGQRFR